MLKNKLLEAFEKIQIDTRDITDKTSLVEDLNMDSQEFIELHWAIEKILEIKLPVQLVLQEKIFGKLLRKIEIYLMEFKGEIYVNAC